MDNIDLENDFVYNIIKPLLKYRKIRVHSKMKGVNMDIILNKDWKLMGVWPWAPILNRITNEVDTWQKGVTDWMNATVPGGVHHDLLQHGYIEDLQYELNSLKAEWVENKWWMYKTTLDISSDMQGKTLTLVFKGLDYKARLYINSHYFDIAEGNFITHEFDITDAVRYGEANELVVLFENVPPAQDQLGEQMQWVKCQFGYKWDFCTRIVNIGFYDDVILKVTDGVSVGDMKITAPVEGDTGILKLEGKLKGKILNAAAKATLFFEGEPVESKSVPVSASGEYTISFEVKNPKLWWPNGLGEQPLYEIAVEACVNGKVSDRKDYRFGFRKFSMRQNDGSDLKAPAYTAVVNGRDVYMKGVNWMPIDHLYGNVSDERYEKFFRLMKDENVNLIRVWGGGLMEKEIFYKLCDRYGMMIWQEFPLTLHGHGDSPYEGEDYLARLYTACRQTIKRVRNHVSHIIWCCGNELHFDDPHKITVEGLPPAKVHLTFENKVLATLRDMVVRLDGEKTCYPCSPFGPYDGFVPDHKGLMWDVHGGWGYEGIVNHYYKFNRSDTYVHSEVGCNGASSQACLDIALAPENQIVTIVNDNASWRFHGHWWDVVWRDREIFGDIKNVCRVIKYSQFIQAEGIRYIIESNRRRAYQNSGTIIWQIGEPWANTACSSVIDYTITPKMAHYFMKGAYSTSRASLKYEKLYYTPDDVFDGEVFFHSCLEPRPVHIKVELIDIQGNRLSEQDFDITAPDNGVTSVFKFSQYLPKLPHALFCVRLTSTDETGKVIDWNLYLFSQKDGTQIFSQVSDVSGGKLDIIRNENEYTVTNTGTEACLFIFAEARARENNLLLENAYETLFPGETAVFTARALDGGAFEGGVEFDYLNSEK